MNASGFRPENVYVCEPVSVEAVLRSEECADLVASIPDGAWKPAVVVSRSHDDPEQMIVRRDDAVRTADEYPAPFGEQPWVLDRIAAAIREVNERRFRYDLVGWPGSDPPVLLRYRGSEGGHFELHSDLGRAHSTRKLSFSLQLSSKSEYDGGTLEFPRIREVGSRALGSVTVFPSFLPHLVHPVTTGTRVVLVGWFHGPAFQ